MSGFIASFADWGWLWLFLGSLVGVTGGGVVLVVIGESS